MSMMKRRTQKPAAPSAPQRPPETAYEAFCRVLREDEERREAVAVAELAAREEQHRAEVARHRRDLMATWEPEKVMAMARDGKLTVADVEEWFAAWRERLDRVARAHAFAAGMSAASGCVARVVEMPDGRLMVETGGSTFDGKIRLRDRR